MKKTTRFALIISTIVLLPVATACELKASAPKTGKITAITPGSAACYDEQNDSGPRRSVSIEYRPAGTDKNNQPWPLTFACVTPEDSLRYRVHGTYP